MDRKKIEETLQSAAVSSLGKPYKYGAHSQEDPTAFDCSSLTQYLYKQIGITLPRRTLEQAHLGVVVLLNDLHIGDLLFFRGTVGHYNEEFPQGIGHVALYRGNGLVIQASGQWGRVVETALEEIKKRKDLVVIKRILKP